MIKPISISLSPNTEPDDVRLAFRLLFQPWKWKKGEALRALEEEFKKRIGTRHAFGFNSGRSALLAILSALQEGDLSPEAPPVGRAGLAKGNEVLLQAFTCNAVPNPVMWAGLKPVYVDCREDDFNIDVDDLERKITPKSRVVIVQHTFGLPADMDRVIEICKRHNLFLIEDCAHALGAEYQSKGVGLPAEARRAKVGTFGKAAFFSFSRDKVISCIYGGMVTTNEDGLAKTVKKFQEGAGYPSAYWAFQQLLHPLAMNWKILPSYRVFGKYLLIIAQWLHVLSKAVHWKEKRGMKPGYFPKRMPNALAILALQQLGKLERFNKHRKEIAQTYYKELVGTSFELPERFEGRENIFLRFAVKHPRAHEIVTKAWAQNLLIGDWYTSPLAPEDTHLEKFGYWKGSCPKAEKLAQITLNLPTHINTLREEVERVLDFLKQYGN